MSVLFAPAVPPSSAIASYSRPMPVWISFHSFPEISFSQVTPAARRSGFIKTLSSGHSICIWLSFIPSRFQVRVGRMFTIISFCPIVSSCRYHSCTCMPRSRICYFKIPAANSNHLLSDTAFHLKLNQVIHLNRVLKRQLLRYIIRKSADDHCARVLLADAA